jgi:hypothetical protein
MKRFLKWLPCLLLVAVLFTPLVFHGQTAQHGGILTFTETNNSDAAVGFNVYRSTTTGGPYTKLNATALSATTLSYTDTTGVGGTKYFYVIRAVDSLGIESANSTEVSGVAIGGTPQAPAGVTLTEQ